MVGIEKIPTLDRNQKRVTINKLTLIAIIYLFTYNRLKDLTLSNISCF